MNNLANLSAKKLVSMVVLLFIIGAVLAIGLVSVAVIGSQPSGLFGGEFGNISIPVSEVLDPTVLTLLTTLLPILVVIGIAMYFIPSMD